MAMWRYVCTFMGRGKDFFSGSSVHSFFSFLFIFCFVLFFPGALFINFYYALTMELGRARSLNSMSSQYALAMRITRKYVNAEKKLM